MTLLDHFVYSVLTSPPKNPNTVQNPYIGDICRWEDTLYVYINNELRWMLLEEAQNLIFLLPNEIPMKKLPESFNE